MPFVQHTPEALLPRSDSKNPKTTCRGLTSSGRPCRRALASPTASPKSLSRTSVSALSAGASVVAGCSNAHAAFYCWQHKDQAPARHSDRPSSKPTNLMPLQERSSIDTLCERLEILEVQDETTACVANRPSQVRTAAPRKSATTTKRTNRRYSFFRRLFCASRSDQDDYMEIVRHRQRTSKPERSDMTTYPPASTSLSPNLQTGPEDLQSQTARLLSLIPKTLSAKTTSTLLTELAKPISKFDEDGYIYIFWLTDQNQSKPESAFASNLLGSPSRVPQQNNRRQSDVLAQYASANDTFEGSKKTSILLKVGRANNVHRRMNEWNRQCGYNLSLVRFYPYTSTTPTPSSNKRSTSDVRMVPFSHRVERLIHIELAEKQIKQPRCAACGREHREWFEVEATRHGLKQVDEIVKRWISWAEGIRSGVS